MMLAIEPGRWLSDPIGGFEYFPLALTFKVRSQNEYLGRVFNETKHRPLYLVEAYQGAFDLIGNIPAPEVAKGDVLKTLEADAAWIEENHEDICQGNRAVANLIDSLTGVYLSTIYKLRNLK